MKTIGWIMVEMRRKSITIYHIIIGIKSPTTVIKSDFISFDNCVSQPDKKRSFSTYTRFATIFRRWKTFAKDVCCSPQDRKYGFYRKYIVITISVTNPPESSEINNYIKININIVLVFVTLKIESLSFSILFTCFATRISNLKCIYCSYPQIA